MQADNQTNDEKLANTIVLIDSAFARIRRDLSKLSPEERAKLREACDSDRCTDNRVYTGRRSVSDVEFDYYTAKAGGGYFA